LGLRRIGLRKRKSARCCSSSEGGAFGDRRRRRHADAFVATFGAGKPVARHRRRVRRVARGLSRRHRPRTATRSGQRFPGTAAATTCSAPRARRRGRGQGMAGGVGHTGTLATTDAGEEGGSGKRLTFDRDGLFKDRESPSVAFPAIERGEPGRVDGEHTAKFRFHGVDGARGGGGRSAGIGARRVSEAMDHMVNMMREHVRRGRHSIHHARGGAGAQPSRLRRGLHYARHPNMPNSSTDLGSDS